MTEPRSYWHSFAKVRFQIRVENFADDAAVPEGAFPNSGPASFGPGAVSRLLSRDRAGNEFLSYGQDIVPYACNVERNSYRKADECRVTIPLAKMPFDPRVIRASTIQVFGGAIDPLVYRSTFDSDGGIELPDWSPNGVSNQIFAGFVDEWEIELSEHDVLQVTARDLTSIFIDDEIPENSLDKIPKDTRLDEVIRILIYGDPATGRTGFPPADGIRIVVEAQADMPALDEIKPPNWFDSKKTVKKGRKRSPTDSQKMSYWDMITDLCVAAGFIVFIRVPTLDDAGESPQTRGSGNPPSPELVISDPRTYYGDSTTFGANKVPVSNVRHFIYGINLDSFKMRRKFGGVKVPTVELRAFDVTTGNDLVGRFPRRAKNNRPSPSGKGEKENVQVFQLDEISGRFAQPRLDDAAEAIYQQLARGEFEIQMKTKSPAALPRNLDPSGQLPNVTPSNIDADIFAMQAGDPIIIGIDRANISSEQVSAPTMLEGSVGAEKSAVMKISGINPELADAIAEASSNQFVQKEFRVQKMIMTWAHTHGWEFEVHAINFLDIRHAIETDFSLEGD